MSHHEVVETDYGTGQKKLGIYILGIVLCTLLTLLAFGVVMMHQLPRWQMFTIIYGAACVQCFVQLVCFLRLNTQTEQARTNVLSLLFTAVILITIIVGSLWIMFNLDYNMMH
jgi:cytochrome o ubiquinol oxidase operon protein cyoD